VKDEVEEPQAPISEPTEETDDPFKDILFEAIYLIRDQVGYKVRSQHTLDLGAL
jgi:hypothetical protein